MSARLPIHSKHGGSKTLTAIKACNQLNLASIESADGYTLTKVVYKLNNGAETQFTVTSGATNSISVPEGTVSVDVYYERDLVPDTGIVDGHLGAVYALLGTLTLAGAAYIIISGKRRRGEV